MSPAQAAHLRMMESRSLVVQHVEASQGRPQLALVPKKDDGRYVKRTAAQMGLPGIARPLKIGEAHFDSITKAARYLHTSTGNIYAMIDAGTAQWET